MTAAIEVRACAGCSSPLVRRDNEGSYNWTRRKYCSKRCSAEDRGAPGRARPRSDVPNDRRCAWAGCGGQLKRRLGEHTADWVSRRYCSQKCQRSRYAPVVGVPKPVFTLVVEERDQSWRPLAKCAGADPNRFGPIEQHERNGLDRCRRAAAEFCRGCPVVAACHRYAEEGDEQGVWAARLRQSRGGKVVVEPLLGEPAESAVAS